MWKKGWRDQVWSQMDQQWDLIIIGGGITGAGILREASRFGLRALLLEAGDFACGTSSRSSKLVHGGFRYLKNAQIRLVLHAVRERERLLNEGRGLINPLGFLLVNYQGDSIPPSVFSLGLTLYDLLALKWGHRHYDAYDIREFCPYLREEALLGGFRYFDAMTDDARLVLRLIQEAVQEGAYALNYAKVVKLLQDRKGRVHGVVVQDESPEGEQRTLEVKGRITINATGAWADNLREELGKRPRIRKLRGSHLVFQNQHLPIRRAISFLHPRDGRPVFAYPWEGVVIVGTTDVDNTSPLETDPPISQGETEYLLEGIQHIFPSLDLSGKNILATYSGIRPVINTGKADPSKESREHILWQESGMLTITGGKLTTFRLMALDALRRVRASLTKDVQLDKDIRVLSPYEATSQKFDDLEPSTKMRLLGRYGNLANKIIDKSESEDLTNVDNTPYLWAELRWAAGNEAVEHLDDLLLRRIRLGLLLPEGGMGLIPQIQKITMEDLGWSQERWAEEITRYQKIWKRSYTIG